jgi:C4-dicarboxylate-specific signal transduction histidine kinase
MAEEGGGQAVQLAVAPHATPIMVKADAAQLRKALSYLILYLTHNSTAERPQVSITVDRQEDTDNGGAGRIMVASRTANVRPERLQRLFDPVQMVQESLIDVGPAVSQRLVEALGGRLRFKQSRHELAFVVSLPVAHA